MNNKRLVKRWRGRSASRGPLIICHVQVRELGCLEFSFRSKAATCSERAGPIIKRTALGRQQFLGNLSLHTYLQTIPK